MAQHLLLPALVRLFLTLLPFHLLTSTSQLPPLPQLLLVLAHLLPLPQLLLLLPQVLHLLSPLAPRREYSIWLLCFSDTQVLLVRLLLPPQRMPALPAPVARTLPAPVYLPPHLVLVVAAVVLWPILSVLVLSVPLVFSLPSLSNLMRSDTGKKGKDYLPVCQESCHSYHFGIDNYFSVQ
jgi:hypothetical protein